MERNALTIPGHDLELRGDSIIITAHKTGRQMGLAAIEFEAAVLDQLCATRIDHARAIEDAVAAEREACAVAAWKALMKMGAAWDLRKAATDAIRARTL